MRNDENDENEEMRNDENNENDETRNDENNEIRNDEQENDENDELRNNGSSDRKENNQGVRRSKREHKQRINISPDEIGECHDENDKDYK